MDDWSFISNLNSVEKRMTNAWNNKTKSGYNYIYHEGKCTFSSSHQPDVLRNGLPVTRASSIGKCTCDRAKRHELIHRNYENTVICLIRAKTKFWICSVINYIVIAKWNLIAHLSDSFMLQVETSFPIIILIIIFSCHNIFCLIAFLNINVQSVRFPSLKRHYSKWLLPTIVSFQWRKTVINLVISSFFTI